MFKPFIAGITALSLTFSTAAPVQANGLSQDDIGKIIFGIAALAAIGTLVDNDKSRRSVEVTRNVQPRQTHQVERPQRQHRVDRSVLPRGCLRSFETRFGTHRMFGRRCLQNNYAHAAQLPQRCSVRIFTNNGPRRGFDPACLRGQGYNARR